MRLILSFLFLFTVCTLVHSNTIYRKYREIELPVVPSEELNNEQNIISDELKKDQIPVRIEIIEPVVILKEDKPIESARNVDLEPVAAAVDDEKRNEPVPELVAAPETIVENLKQTESEAVEQVRSIDSTVELKKDELVEVPEASVAPELLPEVVPLVAETVKNVDIAEKSAEPVEQVVVVAEVQAPSVRNIEADVPAIEEAALEPVIVPVVVPVENIIVSAESIRNLEAAGEIVPEVMRKIEQAEEIAETVAEKQSEILNEIIAKETVRNIEPEVVSDVVSVVPNVVVEEVAVVEVPKEELRSVMPLNEEKIVEVQEKKVEPELVKEDNEVVKDAVKEEVKPVEEIARSAGLIDSRLKEDDLLEKDEKLTETKPEEKLELKEELKVELKPKDENMLRAVDEVVPLQKLDEIKPEIVNEKVEEQLLVVNQDESIGSVRQTAESTTPGNVIQQLLQNNPLTNFIQSIRPQSAAQPQASSEKPSAELNDAAVPVTPTTPTQPPNLIQQIASGIQGGIQGFQANVQGLFNGGQPAGGSGTTRPPFAFISNLFPGQQQQTAQTGSNPPTGGNVPPNPIQGFLGLFNGNRGSTQAPPTSKSTAPPAAEPAAQPALVDNKLDAVKESAEETETSNENYAESEQELYVGEEGDTPALY